MSNPDEVHIYRGPLDQPYRELGEVKAKKRAMTAFHKRPSPDDVDVELRKAAAKMGANAVVDTTYESGVGFTSWKVTTAKGTAVVVE